MAGHRGAGRPTAPPPAKRPSRRKAPSTQFHLVIYRKYLHLVRKNVRSPGARAACYWQLARWWLTDGHLPDVLRDLLGSFPDRAAAGAVGEADGGPDARARRRRREACPTLK